MLYSKEVHGTVKFSPGVRSKVKLSSIVVRNPTLSYYDEEMTDLARIHGDNGDYYYQDGLFYRPDGPAVIDEEGTHYWYTHPTLKGIIHRNESAGPAVLRADLSEEYRIATPSGSVLHRLKGPAVRKVGEIISLGKMEVGGAETLEFWQDGKLHCQTGPAIIPAFYDPKDSKSPQPSYYLFGKKTTEQEVMALQESSGLKKDMLSWLARGKAAFLNTKDG